MTVPDHKDVKENENEKGKPLGKWIWAKVPLWKKTKCDFDDLDCEEGRFKIIRDEENNQLWQEGYFGENDIQIEKSMPEGKILGETTEVILGQTSEATQESDLEILLAELATPSANSEKKEIVPLGSRAKKEAVINEALARILGFEPSEALGEKFFISFVIVGNLIPEKEGQKIESHPEEYTIAPSEWPNWVEIKYEPSFPMEDIVIEVTVNSYT